MPHVVKIGESYVCPVCKWFHDHYQEQFPDEEDCQNSMSLNQARKAWQNGKQVE